MQPIALAALAHFSRSPLPIQTLQKYVCCTSFFQGHWKGRTGVDLSPLCDHNLISSPPAFDLFFLCQSEKGSPRFLFPSHHTRLNTCLQQNSSTPPSQSTEYTDTPLVGWTGKEDCPDSPEIIFFVWFAPLICRLSVSSTILLLLPRSLWRSDPNWLLQGN